MKEQILNEITKYKNLIYYISDANHMHTVTYSQIKYDKECGLLKFASENEDAVMIIKAENIKNFRVEKHIFNRYKLGVCFNNGQQIIFYGKK